MNWKNMKNILSIAGGVLFAFAIVLSVTGHSDTSTDNTTIDISVAGQTWIDITPEELSWVNANPASIPDCDSTLSYCFDAANGDSGLPRYGVEIENIGSKNISLIWLNNTFESSNPYATGQNNAYDAANFVAVAQRGTANSHGPIGRESYYFVNRVEYNQSKWPIYLKLPTGTVSQGRFRDANYEWFWALVPGASGKCNDSDAHMYFSDTSDITKIHNESQTGDTDLTDDASNAVTGGVFGIQERTFKTPEGDMNYTVLISPDCKYVVFDHWNPDFANIGFSANDAYTKYIWNSTSSGNFTPGNLTEIYVQVRISYGVAQGALKQGYLTVIASN